MVMKKSVIYDELQFHAEMVAAHQEQYTSNFTVHGIYFGEGDPEQGGQHWNFTRCLNDDDGVCTSKEIQEVTTYGGIDSFTLTRQRLVCEFNNETAHATQTRKLIITFDLDDEIWGNLLMQTKLVFTGENYFKFVP
jgi:hypothetical protein